MFKKTILTLISIMSLTLNSQTMVNNSIHQFKVADIYGDIFDFSKLKGKKVMIVNTASKCGLTFQYEALQNLYDKYKNKNLIVIGVPTNNFKQAIIKTIKGAGCNASRSNFVGAYFSALNGVKGIPNSWIKKTLPAKNIIKIYKKI